MQHVAQANRAILVGMFKRANFRDQCDKSMI